MSAPYSRARVIYNDGLSGGLESVWVWADPLERKCKVHELGEQFPWLEYLQPCDDSGKVTGDQRIGRFDNMPTAGTYRMLPDRPSPEQERTVYVDREPKRGVKYHSRYCNKMSENRPRKSLPELTARCKGLVACTECKPEFPPDHRVTVVIERPRAL